MVIFFHFTDFNEQKICFIKTHFIYPVPFRFLSNHQHLVNNIISKLTNDSWIKRSCNERAQRQMHISLKIWNLFWSHDNTKIMKIRNRKMK